MHFAKLKKKLLHWVILDLRTMRKLLNIFIFLKEFWDESIEFICIDFTAKKNSSTIFQKFASLHHYLHFWCRIKTFLLKRTDNISSLPSYHTLIWKIISEIDHLMILKANTSSTFSCSHFCSVFLWKLFNWCDVLVVNSETNRKKIHAAERWAKVIFDENVFCNGQINVYFANP